MDASGQNYDLHARMTTPEKNLSGVANSDTAPIGNRSRIFVRVSHETIGGKIKCCDCAVVEWPTENSNLERTLILIMFLKIW